MKCVSCGHQNKESAKACKKCGIDLSMPPAWFPDWKWHGRVLAAIYVCLVVVFFAAKTALRRLPPPYDIRELPPKMKPWLHPEHKAAP